MYDVRENATKNEKIEKPRSAFWCVFWCAGFVFSELFGVFMFLAMVWTFAHILTYHGYAIYFEGFGLLLAFIGERVFGDLCNDNNDMSYIQ